MVKMPVNQVVEELKDHPFTLLTVFGILGFCIWSYVSHAKADEVEKEIMRIEYKVSNIEVQVEANGVKIDRVLALQLAEAIRGQKAQICQSEDKIIKEALEVVLDGLQSDYKLISGGFYNVKECK